MSSRFYIGPSPGGHALRVMKNATDDPATALSNEYEKFAFDSEATGLGYTHKIGAMPDINDLPYNPFVTTMVRYEADWWNVTKGVRRRDSGYQSGTWVLWETQHDAWVSRDTITGTQSIEMISHNFDNYAQFGGQVAPLETRNLIWKLPADNTPHPFPPSSGDIEVFYKYGNAVRLPRPGYSHLDTNLNNFIIHEDLSPAKLIRSGRITIPAGQTVDIQIPPEIGDNLVIGGTAGPVESGPKSDFVTIPQFFASSGQTSILRTVQARFMGDGIIRFREKDGNSAYFAYYVAAENNSSYTSGTGGFLRSHGSGASAYVQMCRPGSGENPSLSDIILDSRWSVMPIIDQGFVPRDDFASPGGGVVPQAYVSFSNPGYVPLVFASWVYQGLQGRPSTTITTTPGTVGYLLAFTMDLYHDGWTGYSRYTEVQPDLVIFNNGVGGSTTGITPNGSIIQTSWYSYFLGVRYYIFAVPQS